MPEELPDYSLCPSCPEIKRKIDRIDLALLREDGTGLNGHRQGYNGFAKEK